MPLTKTLSQVLRLDTRVFVSYVFLIFSISLIGVTLGQAQQKIGPRASIQSPSKALSECTYEYKLKLFEGRVFLEKVKSYRDFAVRGRAASDIIALLWNCDEDFARNSFLLLWHRFCCHNSFLTLHFKYYLQR